MKNKLLTLFFALGTFCSLQAQITITDADMPVANDTFRVSSTQDIWSIDVSNTGPNYTWDFSFLEPLTQTVDTFFDVSATPFAYQFFFNNNILYSDYYASHALPGTDIDVAGFFSMTEIFNYYKNDASDYKLVGFGANLSGVPLSVRYRDDAGNPDLDYIYRFPMDYGNIDSSSSSYSMSIPGIGHYGQEIDRVNEVDGWGTLTTPFGTFQALRIKSVLDVTDTINIDSLGFGFNIPRPQTTEYKWFGQGSGIPLLQIDVQDLFGFPTISSIEYQDSLRGSFLGVDNIGMPVSEVFPNPAKNEVTILIDQQFSKKMDVELLDIGGRLIQRFPQQFRNGQLTFSVADLPNGMYTIRMITDEYALTKKLVVSH
jgi:hypothetical protein